MLKLADEILFEHSGGFRSYAIRALAEQWVTSRLRGGFENFVKASRTDLEDHCFGESRLYSLF